MNSVALVISSACQTTSSKHEKTFNVIFFFALIALNLTCIGFFESSFESEYALMCFFLLCFYTKKYVSEKFHDSGTIYIFFNSDSKKTCI